MPMVDASFKVYLNNNFVVLLGVARGIHGHHYPKSAGYISSNIPIPLPDNKVGDIDPASAVGWRVDVPNRGGQPVYHLVIIHLKYNPRAATAEERGHPKTAPPLTITITNAPPASTDPLNFTFFEGTTTDPAPAPPTGWPFQSFF